MRWSEEEEKEEEVMINRQTKSSVCVMLFGLAVLVCVCTERRDDRMRVRYVTWKFDEDGTTVDGLNSFKWHRGWWFKQDKIKSSKVNQWRPMKTVFIIRNAHTWSRHSNYPEYEQDARLVIRRKLFDKKLIGQVCEMCEKSSQHMPWLSIKCVFTIETNGKNQSINFISSKHKLFIWQWNQQVPKTLIVHDHHRHHEHVRLRMNISIHFQFIKGLVAIKKASSVSNCDPSKCVCVSHTGCMVWSWQATECVACCWSEPIQIAFFKIILKFFLLF